MAHSEKAIDMVYRLHGLDLAAEDMRRQQLQQALNPLNAAAGVTQGAAGRAGARGLAAPPPASDAPPAGTSGKRANGNEAFVRVLDVFQDPR